jgi:hypothetical protein
MAEDGPTAAPGLVNCQLSLAAAAARPGETVTALLQVSCSEPESLELQVSRIQKKCAQPQTCLRFDARSQWVCARTSSCAGLHWLSCCTSCLALQEVEIDFTGIERIDTSWVQPGYRRSTPPINADKRKVCWRLVNAVDTTGGSVSTTSPCSHPACSGARPPAGTAVRGPVTAAGGHAGNL